MKAVIWAVPQHVERRKGAPPLYSGWLWKYDIVGTNRRITGTAVTWPTALERVAAILRGAA